MDSYKDVFYSAGLPALILTGITLVYFILKAYQFAVHAVSHQTEGKLAAATPSGRKQEHGSIEGEQGHTEVPEQVPRSIADQYGAGIQQPSGSFSLSGGWQNVCLAARLNAEEYPVEPSVSENAKRLPSRRNRSTKNGDGQRPSGAYGDSSGVLAEGSGWPDAANEQSRNVRRISSQERSDQNTPDGILGRRDPEKQVSDVSLQTDTCDTLYITKNTLTAYTIAVVQNAQALQYDQMHAALQTGRNQSSLKTPLGAEELLTAHFNLAVLEDKTITDTSPDAKKSRDNTQDPDPSTSAPDDQTYIKIPSRYAENSATRRPHPTGAVAPTCRRDYGLVNMIPAGYESDDSWDNLSHNHDHTHMHNIVPLLTLCPWCNSACRGPEQQQFRQQSATNVRSGNHTEGAPTVNKRFVPEPTVKYNAGIRYNRLIERRCASLDLEAAFKEIQIS